MKNNGATPFYIVTFNLFLFICCKLYMLSVGFGQTQGRRDFNGPDSPPNPSSASSFELKSVLFICWFKAFGGCDALRPRNAVHARLQI